MTRMAPHLFKIVKFENDIFYVRGDGLIKLSAVPLCFQPYWMEPSFVIMGKIRHGRVMVKDIHVDDLPHYDGNITLSRQSPSKKVA